MSATVTTQGIAESLRGRISAVREELERFDALRDELTRLEAALADLQPAGPEQPKRARNSKSAARTTRRARAARPAPTRATTPRRARSSSKAAPRTREAIIEFLRAQGPATAGQVASGLGLKRSSVATRLTQLTKAGHIVKAERGYAAPADNGASKS
jgi:DNA-binding transcriptional ArsR family regulator